jgi:hypothetical protein
MMLRRTTRHAWSCGMSADGRQRNTSTAGDIPVADIPAAYVAAAVRQ